VARVYLAGPMTGLPEKNYPLFMEVAAELRAEGHIVYNPAEFAPRRPADAFPIREAFSEYCKFICEEAEELVLLPDWEASLGVSAELALAKNCGLRITEYERPTLT